MAGTLGAPGTGICGERSQPGAIQGFHQGPVDLFSARPHRTPCSAFLAIHRVPSICSSPWVLVTHRFNPRAICLFVHQVPRVNTGQCVHCSSIHCVVRFMSCEYCSARGLDDEDNAPPLRFIKLQARAPDAVFKPDVVTQSSHFEILLGCMNHSFAQVGRANRIFANRPQFGELSDVDTRQYVMFLIDRTEFKTKQELDDIHHSTHGGLWFYHNHPEWFTNDMLTPTNMRFLSMLVCLSAYGSLTIWRVIL